MSLKNLKFKALLLIVAYFLLSVPIAIASEHGEGGGEGEPKKAEGEGSKKSAGDNLISGGRFSGDPIYIHLQPMFVPIITASGAEQIVTLLVDLKVKNMTIADNIHENMPRVRDALMQSLYGGLGSGTLRNGKIVDVTRVKQKISGAMANLMGEDIVEEVLIQGISQRKL
jgi:flagellar basal body-associated protein FliL